MVTLSVSSLQKSLEYWNKLLGMKIIRQSDTSAELAYSDSQVGMHFLVCCREKNFDSKNLANLANQ